MSYDQHTTVTIRVTGPVVSDTPGFTERDAKYSMIDDLISVLAEAGYEVESDWYGEWQLAVARGDTKLGFSPWLTAAQA
jgi:hypothetical protein